MVVILVLVCTEFQSTSPYAGDDKALNGRNSKHYISIHVPLRGGRRACIAGAMTCSEFQSTSPYAGDDFSGRFYSFGFSQFQSTSPYAGDDPWLV